MKLRAKAYLRIAAEDWRDKYDKVGKFSEGRARVKLGSKWGFVDETGKVVIPLKYDWVRSFSEGFAGVRLGDSATGKVGFINQQGKEVVPPKYDEVWPFVEGLAAVKLGRKWGFINKKVEEVVKPKYDWVDRFSEGLTRVELGNKKGWVTREGKELLLTKDKHRQIKNLMELEKITEEDLINWINERADNETNGQSLPPNSR